jgi:hypothetical protein
VDDDNDGGAVAIRLPVTVSEQARFGIDLEKAIFGTWQRKNATPEERGDSHGMSAAQQRVRVEGFKE